MCCFSPAEIGEGCPRFSSSLNWIVKLANHYNAVSALACSLECRFLVLVCVAYQWAGRKVLLTIVTEGPKLMTQSPSQILLSPCWKERKHLEGLVWTCFTSTHNFIHQNGHMPPSILKWGNTVFFTAVTGEEAHSPYIVCLVDGTASFPCLFKTFLINPHVQTPSLRLMPLMLPLLFLVPIVY